MRLIDADKIHWEYKCISKEEIEDQPTVKAIPIEWLEMQLDVFGDGFYDLRLVIEHWEKENEK